MKMTFKYLIAAFAALLVLPIAGSAQGARTVDEQQVVEMAVRKSIDSLRLGPTAIAADSAALEGVVAAVAAHTRTQFRPYSAVEPARHQRNVHAQVGLMAGHRWLIRVMPVQLQGDRAIVRLYTDWGDPAAQKEGEFGVVERIFHFERRSGQWVMTKVVQGSIAG